jgi:hypothetical protein
MKLAEEREPIIASLLDGVRLGIDSGETAVRNNIQRFGPWALITGASSGIGREFAQQIAASGIHVALVARRKPLLEKWDAYARRNLACSTASLPPISRRRGS